MSLARGRVLGSALRLVVVAVVAAGAPCAVHTGAAGGSAVLDGAHSSPAGGERPRDLWVDTSTGAAVSGEPVRLEGTVPARVAGSTVRLQRLTSKGWRTVARSTATTHSMRFALVADAPEVTGYREVVYRVSTPAARRGQAQVSQRVSVEVVTARSEVAVDGTPSYFSLDPHADPYNGSVGFRVELEAGESIGLGLTGFDTVHHDTRDDVSLTVFDPSGRYAYLDPTSRNTATATATDAGEYSVVLAVADHEPTPVSGLLWVSSPREVQVEADGAGVPIPRSVRPGQPSRVVLERTEGDLFATECVPVSCQGSDVRVFPAADPNGEIFPVGPMVEDLWNPSVTGTFVIQTDACCNRRLYVTSVRPERIQPDGFDRTLVIDRPGAMPSFRFAGSRGERYRLTVTPLTLTGPDGERGSLWVGGYALEDGFVHLTTGAMTRELTFHADGDWTFFLDPQELDLGAVRVELTAVE